MKLSTESTGTPAQETSAPLHLEMCQQRDTLVCVLVFCLLYLVVVEMSVDGEPVCAQALQVFGSVRL